MNVTRHLGRTTPAGARLVLAIAFDAEGVLDTITNTATGERLKSTSYDGRRILRHADAIRDGAAPLDYWHTKAPAATMDTGPLTVACPICKAQPGEHCLPGAPGYQHAPRYLALPPTRIVDVLRWAEQRCTDAGGTAERFTELLDAASDPLVTASANDSNWRERSAAHDRLRAAIAAAR